MTRKRELTQGVAKLNKKTGLLELLDENGEILVQKPKTGVVSYNPYNHARIVTEAMDGKTKSEIAKLLGIKLRTINSWFIRHPDLHAEYLRGKQIAAERYEERMEQIAESVTEKDEVPVANLKIQTFKTLAEINDPGRYSPKRGTPQDASASNKSVTIVFNTGIERTEKPVTVEVKESEP